MHLTRYALNILMALIALLVLPLMLTLGDAGVWFYRSIFFICLLIPAALGPSLSYMVCQYLDQPLNWKARIACLPYLILVGFGICLSNGKAVIDGFFSRDSTLFAPPRLAIPIASITASKKTCYRASNCSSVAIVL